MWHMKTVVIPVVVGALGTEKKGMVENIKKVSERANMTEIQKICMLGSARILRKVLSVWTEWLTWVTGVLGALVCARLMHKKNTSKDCDNRDNNNNNDNGTFSYYIWLGLFLSQVRQN